MGLGRWPCLGALSSCCGSLGTVRPAGRAGGAGGGLVCFCTDGLVGFGRGGHDSPERHPAGPRLQRGPQLAHGTLAVWHHTPFVFPTHHDRAHQSGSGAPSGFFGHLLLLGLDVAHLHHQLHAPGQHQALGSPRLVCGALLLFVGARFSKEILPGALFLVVLDSAGLGRGLHATAHFFQKPNHLLL